MITEDKVRDKARNILGLNESLKGAKADVGQLTTFNQLGFPGISDKPDGSVRISVSGEVIPGAAQRGCPLYLRCSMPDLMR